MEHTIIINKQERYHIEIPQVLSLIEMEAIARRLKQLSTLNKEAFVQDDNPHTQPKNSVIEAKTESKYVKGSSRSNKYPMETIQKLVQAYKTKDKEKYVSLFKQVGIPYKKIYAQVWYWKDKGYAK